VGVYFMTYSRVMAMSPGELEPKGQLGVAFEITQSGVPAVTVIDSAPESLIVGKLPVSVCV